MGERVATADLFAGLRTLAQEEVAWTVGKQLTAVKLSALMKRRDLFVQRLDELIATRGEATVLF